MVCLLPISVSLLYRRLTGILSQNAEFVEFGGYVPHFAMTLGISERTAQDILEFAKKTRICAKDFYGPVHVIFAHKIIVEDRTHV